MPMILCCLCRRRTENPKQRVRIGTDTNWPLMKIHSERNGLNIAEFTKDDFVCIKCHSTISHYRMKDRGPNKRIKVFEPISYEPGITKDVLRGFGSSGINSTTLSSDEAIEGICFNILN